ncbi:hypothetical protein [Flavobacterium sp.]|uniref:hypothetical protein n=1 Tax=Flavobacterium sp. TaxID=239 RepID=UPI000EC7DE15|nr:hypothetical protein [Flavobacterium sp.]HCQ12810.1 hypothetical protein [Flavobacterium sp.]
MTKKIKDINYNNFKIIGIILIALLVVLFSLQWISLDKKISDIKKQNRNKLDSLITLNLSNEIKFSKTDKGVYIVEPEEITYLNNKINILSKEVYRETNRAESIIDKDLDRLNLYMAIGIGFMTLLGIFVPILVNIISVQDLKEKQFSFNTKLDDFQKKYDELPDKETLNKAIEDSNKVSSKLNTLSLQISINRFFNMNANYLQEFAFNGNFDRYVNLLNLIILELNKCKDDTLHKIYEDDSLKDTIYDFSKILYDERFVFATYIENPDITGKFVEIAESLRNLSNSIADNENQNYEIVTDLINELIELLRNA